MIMIMTNGYGYAMSLRFISIKRSVNVSDIQFIKKY